MFSDTQLKFKTPLIEYRIEIGKNVFTSALSLLLNRHQNIKVALITDSHLQKKYQKQFATYKQQDNFYLFVFPAGEKQKNNSTKLAIEKFLLQNKFDRHSILLALGGGVVGDLVGYVASTFMRGIKYYQIPTSIVSVVDSSVGGKTGINNEFGKNLIGTFYHPKKVIIDIDFLKTLPQVEYLAGLAEVLKYAFIADKQLYHYLLKNKSAILERRAKNLFYLIKTSVHIKSQVVRKDEKEGGYRKILNFGHTIGHALENLSQYQLKHGYAISIGMAAESYISKELGYLKTKEYQAIVNLLREYQLPTVIDPKYKPTEIYQVMLSDKKNHQEQLYINILQKIGKVHPNKNQFTFAIAHSQMLAFLKAFQKQ